VIPATRNLADDLLLLDDVCLESSVPGLPGGEVNVELPSGLRFIEGRWHVYVKRMRAARGEFTLPILTGVLRVGQL
jgi:hypothetical protein